MSYLRKYYSVIFVIDGLALRLLKNMKKKMIFRERVSCESACRERKQTGIIVYLIYKGRCCRIQ